MDIKDFLTNEKVCKKFNSQFDLVNYAIRLAENMIKSGRDARVKMESQNRALQILSEIVTGKDQFDEIYEEEEEEVIFQEGEKKSGYNGKSFETKNFEGKTGKSQERKKNRKILSN